MSQIEEIDGPYLVLTSALKRVLNPFVDDVWATGPLRRSEVARAIRYQDFELRQNSWELRERIDFDDPLYDTRRVAYLVVNKSKWPIEIDVQPGEIRIEDGCHRLIQFS